MQGHEEQASRSVHAAQLLSHKIAMKYSSMHPHSARMQRMRCLRPKLLSLESGTQPTHLAYTGLKLAVYGFQQLYYCMWKGP